jgi:Methyltransferase domain
MMPSLYKRLLGRTARKAVSFKGQELVTFPIVRALVNRYEVSIVDFGCGLAQQSRALAEYLRDATVRVQLTLVDIPTLRQEFLLWWGGRAGISTTFLPCTAETPIPELPECDLCLAAGFFEQVHDPVGYFNRMDAKLAAGGLLITGIMNPPRDSIHASSQLGALRNRIVECGYETVVRDRILRKG